MDFAFPLALTMKRAEAPFLALLRELGVPNPEAILELGRKNVAYIKAPRRDKKQRLVPPTLEQRWYSSLKNGQPDFGVYDEDEYLAELWGCWFGYSRIYLRDMIRNRRILPDRVSIVEHVGHVDRVLDLGCGFGLSTLALALDVFPGATVVGTNLLDSTQGRFALKLPEKVPHAKVSFVDPSAVQMYGPAYDVVFASEYFEHFQEPVSHLLDILKVARPRVMIVANSFGNRSIGHFDTYTVSGVSGVPGDVASQLFKKELRKHGFELVPSAIWNGRPEYWRRQSIREGAESLLGWKR